jgi:hypothetical protein
MKPLARIAAWIRESPALLHGSESIGLLADDENRRDRDMY